MATDQELFDEIAAEGFDPQFSGALSYSGNVGKAEREATYYQYKVWNPNPKKPEATPTPGIVMMTTKIKGQQREKTIEVVPKVKAVLLFASPGRKLTRAGGAAVCSAHTTSRIEGSIFTHQIPSVRIKDPLCRRASASDIATILSQWKGYDQAKIDAAVKELTEGGKLQACGIQAKDGFIPLCPYARKDPVTGKRGDCKAHFYVVAWDIERSREFTMELTGQTIENSNRFIAPFHEFWKFIRTAGPKKDNASTGLPCYAFSLDISSLTIGDFNIVNIANWKPVAKAENRKQMAEKAKGAAERYQKAASKLSTEDWKAQRDAQNAAKAAAQPVAQPAPSVAPVVAAPAVKAVVNERPAFALDPEPAVSFDEDDVDF